MVARGARVRGTGCRVQNADVAKQKIPTVIGGWPGRRGNEAGG